MPWAKKLVLLAFAVAMPGIGCAANLVTNGSFESGLTGWTSTGACTWASLVGGASTANGNFIAAPPTDGTHALASDTTQSDMGSCTLHQDVTIPSGGSSSLTLAAGYNSWRYDEGPFDSTCSVSVEVTTTAGAPLATVYASSSSGSQALAARPAVDLSAQNGSTVRIIVTANSCNDAPFPGRAVISAFMDNVVLDYTAPGAGTVSTVPTLSEWSMIVLAALMALIAFRSRERLGRDS